MLRADTPSLRPPVLAVVLSPEGQVEGSIQVQVDPAQTTTPHDMGRVLFALQINLAQSLVDSGAATDIQAAFTGLQDGFMAEFETAFGGVSPGQDAGMN